VVPDLPFFVPHPLRGTKDANAQLIMHKDNGKTKMRTFLQAWCSALALFLSTALLFAPSARHSAAVAVSPAALRKCNKVCPPVDRVSTCNVVEVSSSLTIAGEVHK
jgi:hypothetical protein